MMWSRRDTRWRWRQVLPPTRVPLRYLIAWARGAELATVILVAGLILLWRPLDALAQGQTTVGHLIAENAFQLLAVLLGSGGAFAGAVRLTLYRLQQQEMQSAKRSEVEALRTELATAQRIATLEVGHVAENVEALRLSVERLTTHVSQVLDRLARIEARTGGERT